MWTIAAATALAGAALAAAFVDICKFYASLDPVLLMRRLQDTGFPAIVTIAQTNKPEHPFPTCAEHRLTSSEHVVAWM